MSEAPLRRQNFGNRMDCFQLTPDVTFVKEHRLSLKQRIALSLYARFIGSKPRMERHAKEEKYKGLLASFGLFYFEDGWTVPPKGIKPNSNLLNVGFFQSEKYFADYKEQILKELQFKDNVKTSVAELATKIQTATEATCLHVRLGDYVKNPLHGVADASYYRRALEKLKQLRPNATIFLFSDNTELAKAELRLDDDVYVIPSTVDDQQTMYLGSLCRNFIISNSSFSWWMQYLSSDDDRIVIAPSRWYAQPCPCDIYQDGWTLIEV